MNRAAAFCFGALTSLMVLSAGLADGEEALWVVFAAVFGGALIGLPTARWAQGEKAQEPEIVTRPDGFDARLERPPPTEELLITAGFMWLGLCAGGLPFLSVLELLGYLVAGGVTVAAVAGCLVWVASHWTLAQHITVTGRILTWNGERYQAIQPDSVRLEQGGTRLTIAHESGVLELQGFSEQLTPVSTLLKAIPNAEGSREDVPETMKPLVEGSGL